MRIPETLTIAFPDAELAATQLPPTPGVRHIVADVRSADWLTVSQTTNMLVLPYMLPAGVLPRIKGSAVTIVQSQTAGYDGVAAALPPGVVFCNAAGVHEAATGELALTLILASLRGIPEAVEGQRLSQWRHRQHPGLADKRVVVIGAGGVGREVHRRLEPFDVKLIRVGRSARTDAFGRVESLESLPDLLPLADVVVLAVPLSGETRAMVDAQFLAKMADGALLVNVSRGPVVQTDDLVHELSSGRLHAAVDVTDPEPLTPGHPLWSAPNLLITPHVGGYTGAMAPRMASLLRRQIELVTHGRQPLNRVL